MDNTVIISDSPAKPPPPSSICSSPLPFLALSPIPSFSAGAPRKYSMEEIWRDINFSSLHHPLSNTTISNTALHGTSIKEKKKTSLEIDYCIKRSRHPSTVKAVVVPCFLTLSPINERKKRNPIPESDGGGGGASDHRNKRMMKNRESADRSRARKQAYTTGLELEVSRLMEENDRLRRQLEKLTSAAAEPAQCPKKQTLQRTSTALF